MDFPGWPVRFGQTRRLRPTKPPAAFTWPGPLERPEAVATLRGAGLVVC